MRSYREAIALPVTRGWPFSDVAYFCEDDYLFRPEGVDWLGVAADTAPWAERGVQLSPADAP